MTAQAQVLVRGVFVRSTERCARLRGAERSLTLRGQALRSSSRTGLFSEAQNSVFYAGGGL